MSRNDHCIHHYEGVYLPMSSLIGKCKLKPHTQKSNHYTATQMTAITNQLPRVGEGVDQRNTGKWLMRFVMVQPVLENSLTVSSEAKKQKQTTMQPTSFTFCIYPRVIKVATHMGVRMLIVALFTVAKYQRSADIHKIHQEMNGI